MSDACGWLQPVYPDPGFEVRWTTDEKRQVVSLDQKIRTFCPRPAEAR